MFFYSWYIWYICNIKNYKLRDFQIKIESYFDILCNKSKRWNIINIFFLKKKIDLNINIHNFFNDYV